MSKIHFFEQSVQNVERKRICYHDLKILLIKFEVSNEERHEQFKTNLECL